MSVIHDYELTEPDVKFLVTVRDIMANPQDFEMTEQGETAANVTAIRAACDLTKSQIDYRARSGEDGRGFAQDGKQLIRSYDPTMEPTGFGPRSVELTEKGERVVSEIESEGAGPSGGLSDDAQEQIAELEATVSELQEQVENMSAYIEEIQLSPTGALNEKQANGLDVTLKLVPAHQYALSSVLGVDVDAIKNMPPAERDPDPLRDDVTATLDSGRQVVE